MKLGILFFVFFSMNAMALDAVITVLEAPLFQKKDINSKVVQYKRKGDIIKVHPSLGNTDAYNHMAPSPKKMREIREKLQKTPEWNQDPLFRGEAANTYSLDDEFIPTIDRQGREVYVLTRHIYVYFNSEREFTQVPHKKDETDYRLPEPLPKNYPLRTPTGYRGQFTLGFTQPYLENYPYNTKVRKKGYMSPLDFNLTFLQSAGKDTQDRFFFGVTGNFRYFTNSFSLEGGRFSEERGMKFGIGPYITYDAYKGIKNRINLFGAVNVFLFNQLSIDQKNDLGDSDTRDYRSYSVAPKIGVQYHRKNVLLENLDFVAGSAVELESANTFRTSSKSTQAGFWQSQGSDHFTADPTIALSAFIGVQSAY